jgi:hypothetical protein
MRPDQYERLQALSEKLTDVFLTEADPTTWTGANTPLAEMTAQQRGDRYWEKKNAVATLSLVGRIAHLRGMIQSQSNRTPEDPAAVKEPGPSLLDEEVAAAEAEASKLMDKLERATRKSAFDKRVHG